MDLPVFVPCAHGQQCSTEKHANQPYSKYRLAIIDAQVAWRILDRLVAIPTPLLGIVPEPEGDVHEVLMFAKPVFEEGNVVCRKPSDGNGSGGNEQGVRNEDGFGYERHDSERLTGLLVAVKIKLEFNRKKAASFLYCVLPESDLLKLQGCRYQGAIAFAFVDTKGWANLNLLAFPQQVAHRRPILMPSLLYLVRFPFPGPLDPLPAAASVSHSSKGDRTDGHYSGSSWCWSCSSTEPSN